MHKGQSKVCATLEEASLPSSVLTNFMLPDVVHTMSIDWVWTMGEATATPMNNANQTSTSRASSGALRRVCIRKL